MAIDNQFRINELISSGSRAIVSKDSVTSNHTFIQGSKEVVNEPYPHLKGERDGEIIGRIEKPKYNEQELVKAVDTVVDELIGPPKKPQPDVVPRPVYEDLRRKYEAALARINTLESENAALQAEIESLKAELEALKIQLDAAKLAQTVAENQAQQTQEQYTALLGDFSQAVIKSTKEGIERVSLKGQTEGLIAQKESLREQLKALNNIIKALQGQIETQQALIEQQQRQIEEEQERQASTEALEGQPGTYDQKSNTGFKLKQSEITETTQQIYVKSTRKTSGKHTYEHRQGTAINVYNFNEETPQTFTATVSGYATNWIRVGGPVTVPPREGTEAGKGYIGLQLRNLGSTGARNKTWTGSVTVTANPSGESFTISADYFKTAKRDDPGFTLGSATSGLGEKG